MTTLQRNAMLALLTLTLFGCAETKPQQTTTTVTTTQTTRVVSLRIGMKGSEAIALAGIPCTPSTIKAIDEGGNVTLNYQGHSYVFSKGVLEAVR
jgi:type IV pilus biogenesis protein CpaD/CtpE